MPHRFAQLYQQKYFNDRSRDSKRKVMYRQEYSRLKNYLPSSGKVLDIGCGLGEFLNLFPPSWKKYGTEISTYAKKACRQRGINLRPPRKNNFFDLVIFRGSIQHLDSPLYEIQMRSRQLKKGGLMVFLATPNAGSIFYRLFQDLPMLDPQYNFFIPSAKQLTNILKNYGLKIIKVNYPYLGTPYALVVSDHLYFVLRLLGLSKKKHAFWRNMMEIYAQKP